MATVSDLTITPRSGLTHIDALLDEGPDWNYLTAAGNANTIYYSFSVSSGNEQGKTGQEAFTASQQVAARTAFSYLQQITGIKFVETAVGTSAQIHLCNIDIAGTNTTGLCSWSSPYSYSSDGTLVDYKVNAYVYLDNAEWRAQNRALEPGGSGYQTLLHELGHALGLKHPFEDEIQLPDAQDNTGHTLMSYNDIGGPYSAFSKYDIAALKWLYGGDGLRGALGINSSTGGRYITGTSAAEQLSGTSAADIIEGAGGADFIHGGGGEDTIIFGRARGEYRFGLNTNGDMMAYHDIDGTAKLTSIEIFQFTNGTYLPAQLLEASSAPPAPNLSVSKNAAGYALGNKPLVSGLAEANSTVKVYTGTTRIAETKADANGVWSVVTSAFADGKNYSLYATATNASGNASTASESVSFHVDATAPLIPTTSMVLSEGGNAARFEGQGEAGTTIQLVRLTDLTDIGRTVVQADGTWKIDNLLLPDGAYDVRAVSVDAADNATSAASRQQFTVDSDLNFTGTSAAESFIATANNNVIDGQGGLDTAVYNGKRADFTLQREVFGFSVADTSGAFGTDKLVNVERIKFNDANIALDINGVGGQVYRLYQAVFDRAADTGGQGYWMSRMENGLALVDMAKQFMTTPAPDGKIEFETLYGVNPSDSLFITKLYNNVLNRAPEEGGFNYWMGRITSSSREQILIEFSESAENQANVIGLISNGMDYVPFG